MNYRHHFHAGNFADLVKHAALLAVLERLVADPWPVLVVDTHAGAGGYDLREPALSTGEAAAAARLLDDATAPAVFAPLKAAMQAGAGCLFYPGSPWLVARALRPQDRLVACELRADDHAALARRLGGRAAVELLREDGYAVAAARLKQPRDRALVLIDPPYEQPDDYHRLVELVGQGLHAAPETVFVVWAPLKDLETFDRLLRAIEALRPPRALVAEVRLRPLTDPMRMNGCALLLLNDPGVAPALEAACGWVARELGGAGGEGRVWRLQP